MAFTSLQEILDTCEKDRIPFCEAVLQDDLNERGVTREDSRKQMAALWQAMWDAAGSYKENERSRSGLVGGQGGIMEKYLAEHEPLSGAFAGQVIAGALKMGECNACMKRIVAAPTAGACGVLPAVLVPYVKKYELEEGKVLDALYTAAGIGQVIAARAYIAGASGGCQAEIGTASAMAAAALTHILGGTAQQCADAYAIALGNLLGLVCDPVAGLVEVPCVKRNVIGAVNAVSAANMAVAGITSRIPVDEVIDAMGEVGDALPASLRETGLGGLAATPTGRQAAERIARAEHLMPPSRRPSHRRRGGFLREKA